jgi:hypothetical protein
VEVAVTTLSHSLFLLRRHNAALRTGDHAKAADYRERLDHEDERNGFVRTGSERPLRHGELSSTRRKSL